MTLPSEAVPAAAVYEDEGLDVVFVQTGGESFAKRIVRLGPRHAGWVTILDGVAAGEERKEECADPQGELASARKLRFLLPTELMQERLGIAVGLVAALEHQCAGSLESDA